MINHMVQWFGPGFGPGFGHMVQGLEINLVFWNNPAGSEPSGLLIVPVKDDVKMTSIGERGKCRNVKIYKAV